MTSPRPANCDGPRLRPRWAAAIFCAAWAVYFGALHPWFMNWGATAEEQRMPLAGDELLPDPAFRFTRAITVHAPASAVWRWIVQMGQDRAGFYSNTWLENLSGAGIHNSDLIHPEWQRRAIGDRVPLARPDLFGGRFARTAQTRIVAIEPEQWIANIPGRFVLRPIDGGTTRVLLRESVPRSIGGRMLAALAWDPMHFVMQRGMLMGIRRRAEGQMAAIRRWTFAARIGWTAAAAAVLALFLARRRWPWLLLPVTASLVVLRPTGDWDAALAAFLSSGITLLGAVVWGRRWWPLFLLLAAAVALVLLVAPDPYLAFGFLLVAGAAALLIFTDNPNLIS